MSIVFPYGIAWTQKEKGHVAVNIIISRFSIGTQRFFERAIYSVYFITVVILIWRILMRAREVVVNNETTYGAVAPFALTDSVQERMTVEFEMTAYDRVWFGEKTNVTLEPEL